MTDGAAFVSEAAADAPGYRLTYTRTDAQTVRIRFEIAPPGKEFATYLESSSEASIEVEPTARFDILQTPL